MVNQAAKGKGEGHPMHLFANSLKVFQQPHPQNVRTTCHSGPVAYFFENGAPRKPPAARRGIMNQHESSLRDQSWIC